MRLAQKLLGYLHSAFDRDARSFQAFRLRYAGTSMSWEVSDGVLTTVVQGGVGASLAIDLSGYTIGALATYLSAQPGYSIVAPVTGSNAALSALTLVDASGNQDVSNGDVVSAYTSLAWAYMETFAVELTAAKAAIVEMLKQTSVSTASGEWLDEHGREYYAIPRVVGEPDNLYASRIIAEILGPRGNNVAIAAAITASTDGMPATVSDVGLLTSFGPTYDGSITHNGGHTYSSTPASNSYGLFDVTFGMDLASDLDVAPYIARIQEIVERMRDAGTHLRQIGYTSALADAGGSVGADGDLALSISVSPLHDGAATHNGFLTYAGAVVTDEVVTG